jgi:hypothetical protein
MNCQRKPRGGRRGVARQIPTNHKEGYRMPNQGEQPICVMCPVLPGLVNAGAAGA